MTAAISPSSILPPKGTPARRLALGFVTLAPLLSGAIAMFLGQDANWDLRNYHWYNAWAFWTGRYASGIDFLPSQGQFFHNPTIDIPFYLLATHVPLQLAFFILAAVQGLNIVLLFMLAHLTLDMQDAKKKVYACAALALMGFLGGIGISEIGTVFYDNVTSLGILLAALLVIVNLEKLSTEPLKKIWFIVFLFGIPAGLAAGLKLTSASFCIGLCFAMLVTPRRFMRGFWLAFFLGCGITLGFLMGFSHWAWYLFTHFDSPVFPYFNKLIQAPLIPPVNVTDLHVPPEKRWFLPYLMAVNPYMVTETWWRDWRVPVLYTLVWAVFACQLVTARRPTGGSLVHAMPARFLIWMAGASYFAWVTVQTVYRYIVPIEMLAPLLIIITVNLLPLERRTRATFAAALLAALVLTIQPGTWGRRTEWTQTMADITPPQLPAKAMVLMASEDAYAFLLPQFPPETPFVRIHSRAFHSDADIGITRAIRARMEAHEGPLAIFFPARRHKWAVKALSDYGMRITGKCQEIKDKLYAPELDVRIMGDEYPPLYSLCPVSKPVAKQQTPVKQQAPRKKR